MSSHYGTLSRLVAQRGRSSTAASIQGIPTPPSIVAARTAPPPLMPAKPAPYVMGTSWPAVIPGGRTAGPSPGAQVRQALALAAAKAGAASRAAQARATVLADATRTPPSLLDSRFPYAMGYSHTGGAVPIPAVAGEAMSSIGTGYPPPWRFGAARNPFLSGQLGRSTLSHQSTSSTRAAMDAASRFLAARSRGRNALTGGVGGDSLIGTNTSPIWTRTGRAGGPFEFPPARDRIPGEIGGKRPEVLYGNPLFNEYFNRLAKREGEFSDRPSDPGGPTNRGISQKFLDLLHKNKSEEWGYLPTHTADLTPRQIESVFYKEFYVGPKIYKVAMIPGLLTTAPNLVEQLFDTGVLHGAGTAARIAQLALNEHLTKSVKVDGDVGKETRKAIAAAIRQGKIDDVNNTMVEYRLEAMREDPNFPVFRGGWVPRAQSFRVP